jgi:outer membrane receptor protein involved in Fe transport
MKLEFRQRLLTTTLLVGASMVATPALAQNVQLAQATPPHPECPPGVPAGTANCNPPDTAGGTGSQPETTTPQEATTTVPSTSAAGEPVRSAQDIVITGTRIPQPNLTSSSPITVVTSQEVKLQGTSRTEDLINSLPQSFAAQGSDISNGASGTATVNLRGLGQSRSMVLVNGRRLQPGDVLSPYPDINFVPTQLIKRVDVLTGGASSVYGADAVGGVVNFIMDNTFTGVRLDAQASVFQHDNRAGGDILKANQARGFRPPSGLSTNGGAKDIAGVVGAQFDDGRGHAQAYATYRTQDPVLQSSRDYSFCALAGNTQSQTATLGRRFGCGGSLTSATGTFLVLNPNSFSTTDIFQVKGNQFVNGVTRFNFAPYNYFQRPDERYTLGAFADYEIAPGAKPYIEAMFMDDHTDAQIAPSGDFGNTNLLNCDNPLLSAQEFQRLCVANPTFTNPAVLNPTTGLPTQFSLTYVLRRNVEGGGRDDDIRHDDFRIVGGLRGDPLRGVSYDTYYQFGRSLRNETYFNDFSVSRLARALDVVTNPATGLPVCRSVLTGVDANCVPYNIFQTGGVTPAALAYLQTPGFQRGNIDEAIGHGDVTIQGGEYGLKTPWATNGIGVNAGLEYRKQTMRFDVDQEFSSGDLAGQGGPTPSVHGAFDVREAFAEAQVPIVEHSFIDLLQLSAGFRYSNYVVAGTDPITQTQVNNKFNTKTYKIAAEFAPIRDIRFRAAYNRAVRAPNIVELFFPTSLGLAGPEDPCAGAAPSATLAQCQLTGITPAQYGHISANSANQYNALFGGNANLQPEKADTYTAGVIIQPRFVPGLAVTVDYFNIRIKNLISSPSFTGVFNACMGTGGVPQDVTQCALIHRAPGTGSLWLGNQGFVILTNQNFKGLGLFTKGFDFSGAYNRKMGGMGTLNASFVGTLLTKLGSPQDSGVGRFAGGTPSPKWRHKLRVGFTLPDGIGLSGQWRHFSAVHCRRELGDPGCGTAANPRPGNLQLNQADFFDLALTARVTQKFNLRIGANNILDKAPPVAGGEVIPAGFGNGNTYPQVYDALGRYMFAGMTVDF